MTRVSFDEEQVVAPHPLSTQAPALVRLVMRWGLAKDQRSAEYLLLGVAALAFAVMLFYGASLFSGRTGESLTPDELRAKNGFTGPLPAAP